jgi:hypothetical protein
MCPPLSCIDPSTHARETHESSRMSRRTHPEALICCLRNDAQVRHAPTLAGPVTQSWEQPAVPPHYACRMRDVAARSGPKASPMRAP